LAIKESQAKFWRIVLIITGNIALVTLILILCYNHVVNHKEEMRLSNEEAFVSSVASIRSVASAVLTESQYDVNDKASYINYSDMTMDEALEYLSNSITEDGVMSHVIDAGTFTGKSTVADENGNTDVDYSSLKNSLSDALDSLNSDNDFMNISATFTNPITHRQSVGFLANINVDGKPYILINVISADTLNNKWVFPVKYRDAEMSLISLNGDYIIKTDSFKSENFWEYVRIYNKIGYDEADAVKEEFYSENSPMMKLLDSAGTECCFVCLPFSNDNQDMWFVAKIPSSELDDVATDYSLVGIIAIGMAFVVLFNALYIVDMTLRLKKSNAAANEANRAKTDFLSSMSHDIRTPMNAIIGMTTIADDNAEDPVRVRECLSKISLAGKHLLTLINDILDISKIESGKLNLNPSDFSLADVVSEQINIIQSPLKEKKQKLEVKLENVEYEYLHADELRINQVFINILSNAVKYTNPGGKISVTIKEKLTKDNNPRRVELTYIVKDNGIGMSEEFMNIMFEPFSRMTDARLEQTQGTGLGLAITKKIVDLMNGTIECDSKLGEGTTFTVKFVLPLANNIPENITFPGAKALLIGEDHDFVAVSYGLLKDLKLDVFETFISNDIDEALTKETYDFVCVGVADENEKDTVSKVRAKVNVPVLAVTNSDVHDTGADMYLMRPLFKSQVIAAVGNLLGVTKDSSQAAGDSISAGLEGINILVAEDNDTNWEIIRELLSMYNITSERAANGRIAVEMLEQSSAGTYDVILMDIQMPVMNGIEATKTIRAFEGDISKIPIVAMTADAFAEDVQKCLNAGMNAHTAKPVNMKKLFDCLRAVLNNGGN